MILKSSQVLTFFVKLLEALTDQKLSSNILASLPFLGTWKAPQESQPATPVASAQRPVPCSYSGQATPSWPV